MSIENGHKGREHVSPEKKKQVDDIIKLIDSYPIVGVYSGYFVFAGSKKGLGPLLLQPPEGRRIPQAPGARYFHGWWNHSCRRRTAWLPDGGR